jgi:DNA-binding NtrC family response regulator
MKKILIVDDESTILITLSHLFSNKNTTVITCSTIEEAESALSKYVFDLVVADIRMSGIDGIEGLELLSYIKKNTPETPVIIMTAYGSDEVKDEAYKRGAYYYYEKPIDFAHLIAKINSLDITLSL